MCISSYYGDCGFPLYDTVGILWPTPATDYNEFLSHKHYISTTFYKSKRPNQGQKNEFSSCWTRNTDKQTVVVLLCLPSEKYIDITLHSSHHDRFLPSFFHLGNAAVEIKVRVSVSLHLFPYAHQREIPSTKKAKTQFPIFPCKWLIYY